MSGCDDGLFWTHYANGSTYDCRGLCKKCGCTNWSGISCQCPGKIWGWEEAKVILKKARAIHPFIDIYADEKPSETPSHDGAVVSYQPGRGTCRCPISDLLSNGHWIGCPEGKRS